MKHHRNSNKKYKQNDLYPRKKHGKCHWQTVSPSCLGLNVLTFTRCSMARNCQHSQCNDWVWTDDTQSIVRGIVCSKIINHDHPARPFSNDFITDVGIIYLFLFLFIFFWNQYFYLTASHAVTDPLVAWTELQGAVSWCSEWPLVSTKVPTTHLLWYRWVGAGGTSLQCAGNGAACFLS